MSASSPRPAQRLLKRLRNRGVELETDGEKIRFSPTRLLGAAEVEEIRALKGELIPLLAAENSFGAVTAVKSSQQRQKSCKSELSERDSSESRAVTIPPGAVTPSITTSTCDSSPRHRDSSGTADVTGESRIDKPNTPRCDSDDGSDSSKTLSFVARAREEASALGLVARWSREFGYVSIHDPTTGEWHDLSVEDAPGWAKNEALKRKELRKRGVTRLLTAREMEVLFEAEQSPMWDEPWRFADACTGLVYDEETEGDER